MILTIAAGFQSAVGFGMGMMSVPLLLWSGFSISESVAMVLGASTVQMSVGLWGVREEVDLAHSAPIAAAAALMIPVGVAAMAVLQELGKGPVQQAAGVAILCALMARRAFRPVPRQSVARHWGALAGGGSGFLAGLIGMGGPPIVFYALSHDWKKDKYRAFLWTQFFIANPILLAVLTWRFGWDTPQYALGGVLLAPLIAGGAIVGLRLTQGWEAEQVQAGAVVFLSILGLTSVFGPML